MQYMNPDLLSRVREKLYAATKSSAFALSPDGGSTPTAPSNYTEDRYCAEFNMEQHPWSVEVLSYRDTGGFIYPAECTATWHLPEGDLKYFHGRIRDAKFNIRTL